MSRSNDNSVAGFAKNSDSAGKRLNSGESSYGSSQRHLRRAAVTVLVVALICGAYMVGGRLAQWQAPVQPTAPDGLARPRLCRLVVQCCNPEAGPLLTKVGIFPHLTLMQKMSIAPECIESNESSAHAANYPDVPQQILHAIESSHAQPIERAGNLLYQIVKPNLKAQLLTRKVENTLKVVSFGIAYPSSAEKWQFLEGRPNGRSARKNESSAHLLPLTDNGNRIASRVAGDGQLLLKK